MKELGYNIPEASVLNGHRHTYTRINGHGNSMTELAQWAG